MSLPLCLFSLERCPCYRTRWMFWDLLISWLLGYSWKLHSSISLPLLGRSQIFTAFWMCEMSFFSGQKLLMSRRPSMLRLMNMFICFMHLYTVLPKFFLEIRSTIGDCPCESRRCFELYKWSKQMDSWTKSKIWSVLIGIAAIIILTHSTVRRSHQNCRLKIVLN